LALTTIAFALILPYVHVYVQGADKLIAVYVEHAKATGRLPTTFLSVARDVAQNRIEFNGLIDAIHVVVRMAILTITVWVLSRWRTVRIPFGDAVRAASIALLAAMGYYAILYAVAWIGGDGRQLSMEWQGTYPNSLAFLVKNPGTFRKLVETLNTGALVRFVALAVALRHLAPALRPKNEWLIAGGGAIAIVFFSLVTKNF
jgi:hypothetical protein